MTGATDPNHRWRPLEWAAATAGLAVLAVAGNVIHWPLFFGVDLIFGSVAALVALVWLGPAAGLAAAVAGGLYTVQLWGHPYALLVLALEVGAVALLVRRGWYLITASALYWIVIGGPLALALYSGPLGMDWTAAGLIAVKQPVNGILNATLASFALLGLQAFTTLGPQAPTGTLRLRHLLFSLFMALALLPGMAFLGVVGWQKRLELERALAERMELAATTLARQSQTVPAPVQGMAVTFLDGLGHPLGKGKGDLPITGTRPAVAEGLRIRLPEDPSLPTMVRWQRSHYLYTVAVAGPGPAVRARVWAPAASVVSRLQAGQLRHLALLGILAIGAALGAGLLSRWLTTPLNTLNRLTQGLPERIRADAPLPAFPENRIHELQTFSRAIHQMADALARSLRTSEAARAELEERVRARTADLERRNTELRRLAEVAAHHLQEPARRSMVFAQRLQLRTEDEDPDVRRLEGQIAAMVDLITDLQRYLAYQVRMPERTHLALDEVLAEARAELPEEAESLAISGDPTPLPSVLADQALLKTLLYQLLYNAVRYRQADTPLRIHVSAQRHDGAWVIAVADNGRGMEPDYLDRVFRLFERLHPDSDPGGSGLGLALARLIVENHGGWIRAESEGSGRGATIRFTLPDRSPDSGPSQSSNGE